MAQQVLEALADPLGAGLHRLADVLGGLAPDLVEEEAGLAAVRGRQEADQQARQQGGGGPGCCHRAVSEKEVVSQLRPRKYFEK